MGYRRVNAETLYEILQRLRAGDSNRRIAVSLGLDRKTVNQYVTGISKVVAPSGLGYQETLALLVGLLNENRKPKPAHAALEPWEAEIRSLISGSKEEHRDPMKAKTAWQVVSRRHELEGKTSYESFKRFVRDRGLAAAPLGAVARLESEPGEETQIDYGKMGTREVERRRRVVYAFCGKLCASRNPPVRDLTRSVEFFSGLGFEFDPQFTNQDAACMILGEDNFVMLLVERFYRTFTSKRIADTAGTNEAIIALFVESRQKVDKMVRAAFAAGAKPLREPEDQGFMYGWSFEDLDGHLWEVGHLDEKAMPARPNRS